MTFRHLKVRGSLYILITVLCMRTQYLTQNGHPEGAETCALWLTTYGLAQKNEQGVWGSNKRDKKGEETEEREQRDGERSRGGNEGRKFV